MIGDIGQAESDATRLIERIRSAWQARREYELWIASYRGNIWCRAEPTPPSGPFARLARGG